MIRKLTTKSGLFTIKFCLKKTIQYKYYLQFIPIKKTHIVPISSVGGLGETFTKCKIYGGQEKMKHSDLSSPVCFS